MKSECAMIKTLIVFATRYGATQGTAEEIAKTLRQECFDVKLVNAKEEKITDINEYEVVIVGGGLQMNKWTNETEDFLKKFQNVLAHKKVAIFVSSALKSVYEREGKKDEVEKIRKAHLDDRATKYGLKPIAIGLFGGVINFNKMGMLARRSLGTIKPRFEAAGFKQTTAGVYDTRDWDEINSWVKAFVLKARYL
jgi:menaquinone-dependent protoporphyrinogen oxidase